MESESLMEPEHSEFQAGWSERTVADHGAMATAPALLKEDELVVLA